MQKLVSFRVHRLPYAFMIRQVVNPDEKFAVDWEATNSLSLTKSLNNQTINNTADVIALKQSCLDQEAPALTFYHHDGELTYRAYTTDQNKKELCNKFLDIIDGYIEVLSRDEDALNQRNFTVETNAIVLLHNDVYYGHIYAWVDALAGICFAMGIRNRVNSVFVRDTAEHLPNISGYLLEGVRRFALTKGCKRIFIVNPKPIMEKILPTFGFKRESIDRSFIGRSITNEAPVGICNNCYTVADVFSPMIENPVVHIHYM